MEQDQQTFIFEKQTECKNLCENLYHDDLKSLLEPDYSVYNPQYAYNKYKNACFYSGGWLYLSIKGQGQTNRVVNCQTNEEVLTYITTEGKVLTSYCETCVGSIEEYRSKEKDLMDR